MPGTGKVDARGMASKLGSSFIDLKLALVLGVCGGVPKIYEEKEIVLGDVIMSTALVEHDSVKQYPQGRIRKNSLEDNRGRPNSKIRAFIAKIKADHTSLQNRTSTRLEALCQQPGLEGS
jgi:nucleoside phosphorylase